MGGGYSAQPFYHMASRQTMPYSTSVFGVIAEADAPRDSPAIGKIAFRNIRLFVRLFTDVTCPLDASIRPHDPPIWGF
jgi:hypothetical protein